MGLILTLNALGVVCHLYPLWIFLLIGLFVMIIYVLKSKPQIKK